MTFNHQMGNANMIRETRCRQLPDGRWHGIAFIGWTGGTIEITRDTFGEVSQWCIDVYGKCDGYEIDELPENVRHG